MGSSKLFRINLIGNRTFFITIFIFIIFFGLILYFGAKQIYDRESKWRDETGKGLLSYGEVAIESIFNNFDHEWQTAST